MFLFGTCHAQISLCKRGSFPQTIPGNIVVSPGSCTEIQLVPLGRSTTGNLVSLLDPLPFCPYPRPPEILSEWQSGRMWTVTPALSIRNSTELLDSTAFLLWYEIDQSFGLIVFPWGDIRFCSVWIHSDWRRLQLYLRIHGYSMCMCSHLIQHPDSI